MLVEMVAKVMPIIGNVVIVTIVYVINAVKNKRSVGNTVRATIERIMINLREFLFSKDSFMIFLTFCA